MLSGTSRDSPPRGRATFPEANREAPSRTQRLERVLIHEAHLLGHILDRRDQDGLPRDEKSRKVTANARRQPTERSVFPEHTVSGGWRRQPEPMGRRVATGWWRGCRGRGVGAGRPPSGHGERTGGRGSRGSGGRGWKPPAAVARGARPRDAGRAKVTQRRADSLAGPARGPRPERPRVRQGRAASVSPRGRAGPGRAGPGGGVARGPRGRRAGGGGRGPVTCGRRRRAFPPCPAGWSSSRPRSRSPSRASGRRAAAWLRPSSRRAEPRAGPPRGEGARRHGCGTWEPAPRLPPYGKMAAPGRPPPGRQARSSARPGYPAPGGAQPVARGV